MDGLLEKRQSLHKQLREQQRINTALEAQLNRLQPLANLGVIAAMIAHEMNNILTPLGSYAQLAQSNPDDIELAKKTINKTALNTDRAAKILKSMLAMSNGEKQEKKTHNFKALVDEVFTLIARDFSKDRIKLNLNIPEDITIYAEAVSIQQVLMNLILNAREAIISADRNSGILSISAQKQNGVTFIEIVDNGCGIPKKEVGRIFDVFYTTKKDTPGDAGTGLGLAFCKRVIDDHDANISVNSELGTGTVFKIMLPDN